MAIVGIDLGTTNSLIGVWKDDKCELIPNSHGEFITPSIINIGNDGILNIGKVAREKLISDPSNTIASIKRMMGTDKKMKLGGKGYYPQELSSLILRKLKEDAEVYLGEEVTEAVISVPAYFNDKQRYATKQAGKLAGLTVRRLVNEPSAAALAYCMDHLDRDGYYMVVDFGGGTLDVSIIEYYENIIEIIAVAGDNHLGGNDFDLSLAKHFCREHQFDYETMDSVKKAILLKEAEKCKMLLSSEELASINLEMNGNNYAVFVDNNKLIEISTDIFKRFKKVIDKALADSKISRDDINEFILVGGSCKMPAVQSYLNYLLKKSPVIVGSPDEIVAIGAATFAGIKERNEAIKDILLTDICPFTLGVGVHNRANPKRLLMSPIIERNSTLPSSKVHSYTTVIDNQTIVTLNIYQGESMYCDENLSLGELSIYLPPAPKGKEKVDVRMSYDINGILEIEMSSSAHENRDVIYNKDFEITEKEIEEKLNLLTNLKIHPRDQEINQMIIARGERLFQENTGAMREMIQSFMEEFQVLLQRQEEREIRIRREKLNSYFDSLDRLDPEEQKEYFTEWLSNKNGGDPL